MRKPKALRNELFWYSPRLNDGSHATKKGAPPLRKEYIEKGWEERIRTERK